MPLFFWAKEKINPKIKKSKIVNTVKQIFEALSSKELLLFKIAKTRQTIIPTIKLQKKDILKLSKYFFIMIT